MREIKKYILILLYLVALVFNFMPAIKFPDGNLNFYHLVISICLLVGLLIYTGKKMLRIWILIAFGASLTVFGINSLENQFLHFSFLDVIANIQYPLYMFFVIPLFGLNKLLNLSYGSFSLIVSLIYLVILASNYAQYKWKKQNVAFIILVLMFYCFPFGYYAMYLDFTKGTMIGYLIMIIGTIVLAYICKSFLFISVLLIGNILSIISSLYFIHMMNTTVDWGYYFKPFRPYTVFFISFLLNCIPQWIISKSVKRRSK
ncbi:MULTISPECIES: hypothetical protein [Psychrobacillus]|uniref:YhhN-like protein n=1 Tax=Psychrobacillus faecigallinarum TaxID=2762235 RepID=A0ABR8R4N1_9BACI|nr:hypothetical protein [Psychrobacillus faecigallinarum]MBD7942612.1 hypothetical protein [Psychrobacillus faecigallinarum]